MATRSVRPLVVLVTVLAAAAFFGAASLVARPDDPSPLTRLRERTAGLSDADLASQLAIAETPAEHAELGIMLAERVARRDPRGETARIAELFSSADELVSSPALHVEAALLGARLLALDPLRQEAAIDRLRRALSVEGIPDDVRDQAEFGLAHLTVDPEEAFRLLDGICSRRTGSPYAVPAALAAFERAGRAGHAAAVLRLRLLVEQLPAATTEDKADALRRAVSCGLTHTGGAEMLVEPVGRSSVRLEPDVAPGSPGLLVRLSPARPAKEHDYARLHVGELDTIEAAKTWMGPAPEDLLVGLPAGRYVAFQAEGEDLEAWILTLTAIVCEVRADHGMAVIRLCDPRNGASCPGVHMTGWWETEGDRHPIEADTDATGLARISLADDPPREGGSVYFRLHARSELGEVDFDDSIGLDEPRQDDCRAALYASKPLFSPGESVEYKLVVRRPPNSAEPPVPVGARFTVSLTDQDGEALGTETLAISEFGTASGKVTLPAAVSPGWITATVESLDPSLRLRDPNLGDWEDQLETFSQRLARVENYVLADLRVEVTVDRDSYALPALATLDIAVTAAEGGVVPDFQGEVDVYAYASDPWWQQSPLLELPFVLAETETVEDDEVSLRVSKPARRFVTGPDGKAQVRLPLAALEGWATRAQAWFVAVGSDAQGRSGRGTVTAWVGSEPGWVAVTVDDGVWTDGGVKGVARPCDLAGRELAIAVEARLLQWRSGAGGEWSEIAKATLPPGDRRFDFGQRPSGSYRVEAHASHEGRTLTGDGWAWVWGRGEGSVQAQQLTIRCAETIYRPGDLLSAEVIVPEGVSEVQVGLEGERILDLKVIPAVQGRAAVEFTLPREAAPNVQLVASTWSKGEFARAQVERYIDPRSDSLEVTVEPSTAESRPGEATSWTVRVRDAQGRPVDAEVSLAIVDERVYDLQAEPLASLLRPFAPLARRHCVGCARTTFEHEECDDGDTGVCAAFELAESSPEDPPVRRDFRDLAAWFPSLRTGAKGEVTIAATFTDSLTTWRATARAAAAGGTLGETRGRASTRLPMSVRLDLPRLLRVGDEVAMGAVVRNLTEAAQQGTVTLTGEGLEGIDETPQEVVVPAGGTAAVTWRVRAWKTGTATLRATARCTGGSDAAEESLVVLSQQIAVPFSARGSAAAGAALTLSVPVPRDPSEAQAEVRVASEDLLRIVEPLEELVEYPHGCVEQTMSGFLPGVLAQATLQELGVRWPSLEAKLPAVQGRGIGRLAGFQHEDGGWGWWTQDETDPFMTCYVLYGLLLARDLGAEVPEAVLWDGIAALPALRVPEDDVSLAWLRRWVECAGGTPPEKRQPLADPGKDAVAVAFAARVSFADGDEAAAVPWLARLAELGQPSAEGTCWSGRFGWWSYPEVATAIAVETLIDAEPSNPAIAAGLRWLDSRRSGSGYGTTVQNAFAALAAARHFAAQGKGASRPQAKLSLGGLEVEPEPGTDGDPFLHFRVPGDALAKAGGRLDLENADPSAVSATVRGSDAHPADDPPTSSAGMSVARILERRPNPDADVWEPCPPKEVVVGERYRVRYLITLDKVRECLALIDPRCAGLEPIDPQSRRQDGAWLEFHAQHVGLFLRNAGQLVEVAVEVRFETSGTVQWPPARLFEMYDETHQAFGEPLVLEVSPPLPRKAPVQTVDGLTAAVERWMASDDVPAQEAELWRHLPAGLTDEDRAQLWRLALSCRSSETTWRACQEPLVLGVLSLLRPDVEWDVERLLELTGSDTTDEWPELLRDEGVWWPHEETLVRLAIERGHARAWLALGLFEPSPAALRACMAACSQVPGFKRLQTLTTVVQWVRRVLDPYSFDTSFDAGVGPFQEARRVIEAWLAAVREEGGPHDKQLVETCSWVEAHLVRARNRGEAIPVEWTRLREECYRSLEGAELDAEDLPDDISHLELGERLLGMAQRSYVARPADALRRKLADWMSGFGRGVAPTLALLEDASIAGDPAAKSWLRARFLLPPPPLAEWAETPEERRELLRRVARQATLWLEGDTRTMHERLPDLCAMLAWGGEVHDRADDLLGEPVAEWNAVMTDLFQRLTIVPVENDELQRCLYNVRGGLLLVPSMREWLGGHVEELAAVNGWIVLSLWRDSERDPDDRMLMGRVHELPEPARASVLSAALGRWEGVDALAWAREFAHDPAEPVREVLVADETWVGWRVVQESPELLVEMLRRRRPYAIAASARLQSAEALAEIERWFDEKPEEVRPYAGSLARYRLPAAHRLLAALAPDSTDVKPGRDVPELIRAEVATRPTATPEQLSAVVAELERLAGSPPADWLAQEIVSLAEGAEAASVRAMLIAAENPLRRPMWLDGAIRRIDGALVPLWMADLAGEGLAQEMAIIGLAEQPGRAGQEALIDWLLGEGGKAWFARRTVHITVTATDDGVSPRYLGPGSSPGIRLGPIEGDPLGGRVDNALGALPGRLPADLLLRLIDRAGAPEETVRGCLWLSGLQTRPPAEALPSLARLAERIVASGSELEPGYAARDLLLRVPQAELDSMLRSGSDDLLVAMAPGVFETGRPDLDLRIWRLSAKGTPDQRRLLAAFLAQRWRTILNVYMPGLTVTPPPVPLALREDNPFAETADEEARAAVRRCLGEDPFAGLRR